MTTQFLYFDMGNVLLFFDQDIACRRLADLADTTPEQVREFVLDGPLQGQYERGELETEDFHAALCRQFDRPLDLEATKLAASEIFTLNLSMIPVLVQLAASERRLGILSNTCDAHWRYCEQRYVILRELFSVHALSFRLKSSKPEPQIYERAAELAGVPSDQIFFVDDRPENVAGAREAGFDAVPFTSVQQLIADLRKRNVEINY